MILGGVDNKTNPTSELCFNTNYFIRFFKVVGLTARLWSFQEFCALR